MSLSRCFFPPDHCSLYFFPDGKDILKHYSHMDFLGIYVVAVSSCVKWASPLLAMMTSFATTRKRHWNKSSFEGCLQWMASCPSAVRIALGAGIRVFDRGGLCEERPCAGCIRLPGSTAPVSPAAKMMAPLGKHLRLKAQWRQSGKKCNRRSTKASGEGGRGASDSQWTCP